MHERAFTKSHFIVGVGPVLWAIEFSIVDVLMLALSFYFGRTAVRVELSSCCNFMGSYALSHHRLWLLCLAKLNSTERSSLMQ
jgi:hypothetical protein